METRNCLICSAVKFSGCQDKFDKLDALFLLRILLEIPQDDHLFENINKSLSSLQICESCESNVKQCKQIYVEIGENIERFWECQNKLLEKISQHSNKCTDNSKANYYENWASQCRKFVKDHDFTGFGYPFIVHDLETLLISSIPPPPENLNCAIINHQTTPYSIPPEGTDKPDSYQEQDDNYNSLHKLDDLLEDIPSPLPSQSSEQNESTAVKQEPESEDDQEDNQQDEDYLQSNQDDPSSSSEDNDSDYTPSPSKKPKISSPKKSKISPSKKSSPKKPVKKEDPQIPKPRRRYRKSTEDYPNFERDPTTNKFHCHWSTPLPDGTSCSQKFVDKKSLRYHWDRHRNTPRQICDKCPLKFYSQRDLVRHSQLEHPKDGDKFECDLCGKKCGYSEALYRHKRSTHEKKKEEERLKREKIKKEDPIRRDPVTKQWLCYWPDCKKGYFERKHLNYHIDRHRGTPQQKCGECGELFFSKCQLNRHRQMEHEKDREFVCDICGDKFSCKNHLYTHKSYRHSENGIGVEIVCEICGVRMKKASLRTHLSSLHGQNAGVDVKKFCCHLCPGRFGSPLKLKMHLWRVHDICEDEKDLERLRKKWEGMKEKGKQWRCQVKGCRIPFVTEEGLRKHVDGVHGGVGEGEGVEGKFKCEICGKGFHTRQKLTRHLGTVHSK